MESVAFLQPDEQRELLRIARATLREYLDSARIPPGKPHRASLLVPAGVTVRIYRGGEAKPAVESSSSHSDKPLFRAIQEVAVAALTDGGFDRDLTDDELMTMAIEVVVHGSDQTFRDTETAPRNG